MKSTFYKSFLLACFLLTSFCTKITAQCWQTVSAGSQHTLAIKADGSLWAWGSNEEGQLGDGTTTNRSSPTRIVNPANNWTAISAGAYHSIALKADGTLWAWGYNGHGRLGDGTTMNRLSPVQIGSATDWVSINAGTAHNVAIKSTGTLWAWGNNTYGQLGDGTTTSRNSPTPIGADTWQSASAGGDGGGRGGLLNAHTLGIKRDGTLWAWGNNNSGQLARGSSTISRSSPTQIGSATDNHWRSVSAGGTHSTAIKTDGTLWTWGSNLFGELGDGTTTSRTIPTQIGTATNWQTVSASNQYTVALSTGGATGGTLWATGYNLYGQLGDGTTMNRNVLTPVGSATNWATLGDMGFHHSVALKTGGSLWVWGINTAGRLGNGMTENTSTPTNLLCPVDVCNSAVIGQVVFSDAVTASLVIQAPSVATNILSYEYAVTATAAAPALSEWIATPTAGTKMLRELRLYTAYYVHLRSICSVNNSTAVSQPYTHNPRCTTPSSVNYSAISYTSANIHFTMPSAWISEVQYEVSRLADFSVLTTFGTVASTAPIPLSGLTNGTPYYVRLRAVCGGTCSTTCDWTESVFVTTACLKTLLLTQRANSTNRVVFHWIPPYSGLGQAYTLVNKTTNALIASGTLAANLGDIELAGLSLAPNTKYVFNIRKQCTATDFSEDASLTFTPCDASPTLPYTLDFSTSSPDALPCSWETQGDEIGDGWRVLPIFGNNALAWSQDFSDGDWAYSPNFNFLTGAHELLLDFETIQSGAPSTFKIYLTNSYDPSVFTLEAPIFEHRKSSAARTNLGIPFTVGSVGTKHLVFHGEQGVQNIHIYKMTVRQTPAAADLAIADYIRNNVCNSFYAYNVNSNGWYHIYNTTGNIVASVNPGTVNLGTVTLQMKAASTVEAYRDGSGVPRYVLPRHFAFSSSNYPTPNVFPASVQLRIYFTEAELAALRTAARLPSLTASGITITHFSSAASVDCNIANNFGVGTSAEVVSATLAATIGGGNHCLQFPVTHFSEFAPHTPSTTPLAPTGTALPIDLLNFSGHIIDKTTVLTWQTGNEVNNKGFQVEWLMDNGEWLILGFVNAKGKASIYEFIDDLRRRDAMHRVSTIAYYRLRQIDNDGKETLSKVVNVRLEQKGFSVKTYPNPFKENVIIEISAHKKTDVTIELIDILGRQIFVKKAQMSLRGIEATEGVLSVPISTTDFPNGTYFLKISDGQQVIQEKVVKH